MDQCCICTQPGVTTRDGAPYCTSHVWTRAMARVTALFAGEVLA